MLVAQGFTQRPGIDYDETYSPVMSGITFRYIISMAANLNLKMQLMDVVTAYLYGSLERSLFGFGNLVTTLGGLIMCYMEIHR